MKGSANNVLGELLIREHLKLSDMTKQTALCKEMFNIPNIHFALGQLAREKPV